MLPKINIKSDISRRILTLTVAFIIIVSSFMTILTLDTAKLQTNEETITPRIPEFTPTAIDLGLIDYDILSTADAYEGYNLFVLGVQQRSTGDSENIAVIMDMDGNVIHQKYLGAGRPYKYPAEFINPNTVLIGTPSGVGLWHLDTNILELLGISGHHEYEYNPIDDTIFTFEQINIEINGSCYWFDSIKEYALSGALVWELNVSDFISETWLCPYNDTYILDPDVSHSNTIFYDADEDIIFYNSRNTNTFFKINHTTKKVIWGLGEYGNFTLFDINGVEQENLFYHGHAVEPIDADTFIIFDNDLHNQTYEFNEISRVLEIDIDLNSMTANESWYWEGPPEYYSAGWGDADRLPNGNRLGTFGYWSAFPEENGSTSIVEINEAGEVVWELSFPWTPTELYGIYRSERILFAPHIDAHPDVSTIPSVNTTISWNVTYNYRTKNLVYGNYWLYVDGLLVTNDTLAYPKYSQMTELTLDLGYIPNWDHNVTLGISDEHGNLATDEILVISGNYLINRTGPESIELGQGLNVTWSGMTVNPLLCNITYNATDDQVFTWTGQDINIDPEVLGSGTYNILLQLFNGTTLEYEDSFTLIVYDIESPLIESTSASVIYKRWGDRLDLQWNITDRSILSTWYLSVNGITVDSSQWSNQTLTLTWSMDLLEIGVVNITVLAIDALGLRSTKETLVFVQHPLSPIIASSPEDMTILWGTANQTFSWEFYGGTYWELYRNDTLIGEGDVTSNIVEWTISDWYTEDWHPGYTELTFHLTNGSLETSSITWLTIIIDLGDPYADSVIQERSEYYFNGENALGAPDGLFAVIFFEYTSGKLTLDMGFGEEIIDGPGNDFIVTAQGGRYSVWIGNSLNVSFTYLAIGDNVTAFDLYDSGFDEVRYVRINYLDEDTVELDAITAIHYNFPEGDAVNPSIIGPDDYWVWDNVTSTSISWTISDATPWNYVIFLNNEIVVSNRWTTDNISFVLDIIEAGDVNITLVVYDAYGNSAFDTVMVEIYDSSGPSPTSTAGNSFPLVTTVTIVVTVGIIALAGVVFIYWFKEKRGT